MSHSKTERLQKRLARAGVASRRASEELISAGRVKVNGVVASVGQQVSELDHITVDDELVGEKVEALTFMLYKPRGYVTSASDEFGRKTVISAMPEIAGLHAVGRLDKDSEGLLLLTTDGELTQTLTHPRYGHQKAYRAWTDGAEAPSAAELAQLTAGLELSDGSAQALSAEPASAGAFVVLGEGRNRQVRRMLEEIGHPVGRLLRYRVGGLWLENMEVGEYQQLTARDLQDLLKPERIPPQVWERNMSLIQRRWG